MRDSKNRSYLKHIICISPDLVKPSAHKHRDALSDDVFRLSNSRKNELLNKNGFDEDDNPFNQIQMIGVCEGFGGTLVTAHVYLVTII